MGAVVEPRIQYAKTSDGVNIAYYAIGDGPTLVSLTPGSHLERQWQYPEQRAWFTRLAANARLVRLDHRGSGLSDRDPTYSLDQATLDIEAVVRKEGLQRFALLAQGSSGVSAILYASRHPETVSRLVLWCPYTSTRSFVQSSPPLQAVLAGLPKDWVTFTEFVAELMTGRDDTDQARRYASYIRDCFTTEGFLARRQEVDVTSQLVQLRMPVLVLQRTATSFPTPEQARKLATDVPGARLVLLEGAAALPFLGDTDAVLAAIDGFLSEPDELRPGGLTEREVEILALLSEGASNEGIAATLSISTRTVERHIGNIYLKIGAHNRAEATAYAFRQGIAPSS
jgi:pimeloyl-ACP methyl ester carboxylesterase/DNA-binding CsgD family transcriptional regulator